VIRWDGKVRGLKDSPVAEWNRDNSLASGMRYSTVWFYQEVARRAGERRMQQWIDKAGYGNRDIGGGIDTFWLSGALRISAEQQIDFLRRLADDRLPFSPRAQEIVRRISITDACRAEQRERRPGLVCRLGRARGPPLVLRDEHRPACRGRRGQAGAAGEAAVGAAGRLAARQLETHPSC
jgi:hypothetical protein